MKGIKQIFLMAILCLSSLSIVIGCGSKEIDSMAVKSGLVYTYLVGDDYSFDDIKMEVVYNDGSTETIGKDKLKIGEFSTTVAGDYDVKFKYKDKEITVTLKVTSNIDEAYDIFEVEESKHFVQYYNSIKETPSSEADPESIFYVRGRSEETMYVVGDDNEFSYQLNLTALSPEGEYVEDVKSTKAITTFYVKDSYDGEYRKLEDDEVYNYVEVINSTTTYKFKEGENAATNKFFKLEVRPYYLKDFQLSNVSRYTKTLEFKVVDGYNITDAKQLGILYNNKDQSHYEHDDETLFSLYDDWNTDILNKNNIIRKDDLSGIILHNDITITAKDIPSRYLGLRDKTVTSRSDSGEITNVEAVYVDKNNNEWVLIDDIDAVIDVANGHTGKCDGTNIYCHEVKEGKPFNIYGNYFTLNAKLPTVDTGILPTYGSTTSLFKFVSTYSELESDPETLGASTLSQEEKDAINAIAVDSSKNAVVNFYNLNSIGNAQRTDSTNKDKNKDSARMGGLIFFKSCAATVNVYNSIVKAYLVNFYMEKRLSNINLKNVKSYDAYQSILYNYRGGNLNVKDSELKRAGGPVMLVNFDYDSADERQILNVNFENTILESWVSGLEPWFSVNGATESAAYLKAQKDVFKGEPFNSPSTFVKEVKIKGENGTPDSTQQLVNIPFVSVYTGEHECGQVIAKITIDNRVVKDSLGLNTISTQNENVDLNKKFIYDELKKGASIFASIDGAIISASGAINSDSFIPDLSNLMSTGSPTEEELQIIAEMIELEIISSPSDLNEDTVTQYVMAKFVEALDAKQNEKDYLGIYVPGMSMVVDYFYSEIIQQK